MDQDLIRVLEKIANNLEQSNETLNRIADHYDGVVPVMTRNANRAEALAKESDQSFGQQVRDIFRPQEH